MKKIHFLLLIFTIAFAAVSCNDEWDEELYKHYVSFKAPLNAKGVTDIYVKYKKGEASNYQLPLIVSGTTTNPNELNVKIALDPDSLNVLNYERFQNRHELYFRQLESTFYNMPQQSVTIPAGSRQALLPINFKFEGIDMFYKWILPLTIVEEESNNYRPHPRKNYRKAMLRVIPFNDYSGVYQSTAMRIYFKGTTTNALVVSTRTASVVEDSSMQALQMKSILNAIDIKSLHLLTKMGLWTYMPKIKALIFNYYQLQNILLRKRWTTFYLI